GTPGAQGRGDQAKRTSLLLGQRAPIEFVKEDARLGGLLEMEAGGVLTIGGVEGHMVRTDLAGRHIQQSPDPHALATHSGILDRYVTHLVTSRKFGERVEIKDERLDDRAYDPQKRRPQRGWFGGGLDQGAH